MSYTCPLLDEIFSYRYIYLDEPGQNKDCLEKEITNDTQELNDSQLNKMNEKKEAVEEKIVEEEVVVVKEIVEEEVEEKKEDSSIKESNGEVKM